MCSCVCSAFEDFFPPTHPVMGESGAVWGHPCSNIRTGDGACRSSVEFCVAREGRVHRSGTARGCPHPAPLLKPGGSEVKLAPLLRPGGSKVELSLKEGE